MSAGVAGKGTAVEIAERLWPPPDPVNHCRREAIAHIGAADRKLRVGIGLRSQVDPILFEDLARLWIRPTRAERWLGLVLSELRAAEKLYQEALDLLASARSENEIRFYDERIAERREQRGED